MSILLSPAYRGDDIEVRFTLQTPFVAANFTEIYFTVRDTVPATSITDDEDAAVKVQLSIGGGSISFGVSATVATVTIPKATSTTWAPGSYPFDCQGILTDGKVKTIGAGLIRISADITRRSS